VGGSSWIAPEAVDETMAGEVDAAKLYNVLHHVTNDLLFANDEKLRSDK
jgi:hypothetical protein